MAQEVKVLRAWGSPFSWRVEIALKLKGVEYQIIEEDLANKSPLLLKCNPAHKKVPVLLHNGKPIAESPVILEYIEETWKEKAILPEDPYERAMARFWAKFVDEKCLEASWKACWSDPKEQEKAMEEALKNLKTLENGLEGKRFFGGDTIGLVDITASFIAHWLGMLEEITGKSLLDAGKFPILHKWIQEFSNSSVVKESLPPRDKLIAFFKPRYEAILAAKVPVY